MIGATAIEDKLQDGVPEAIATLLEVWKYFFKEDKFKHLHPGWFKDVGIDGRQDGDGNQHRIFLPAAEFLDAPAHICRRESRTR